MAFRALVIRARSAPLTRLPVRVCRHIGRQVENWFRRQVDRRRSTTISDEDFADVLQLGKERTVQMALQEWQPLLDSDSLSLVLKQADVRAQAGFTDRAIESLAHRFDLLGSEPFFVSYTSSARGAYGRSYKMAPGKEAEHKQLVEMGEHLNKASQVTNDSSAALDDLRVAIDPKHSTYRPVDWHVDFKSGYRWNKRIWAMDIRYGHLHGVDIKVPWELSRAHHLAILGIYALTTDQIKTVANEVSLELLDWITANPPRFGVNWRSAMDVAIRAVNWIWALTLFDGRQAIPLTVKWLVTKSLYQHALHIESNLDNLETYTTNHYLADVIGLMYIAFSFPQFPRSDKWFAFCLRELVNEMKKTVYPDGVNYEAATGYHRLVTEMFLHGTLLAIRLKRDRRRRIGYYLDGYGKNAVNIDIDQLEVLPDWYYTRLRRMVNYVADTTKPSGLTPQFGDHDSGRLIKFTPKLTRYGHSDHREEPRNHRHIVATGRAIFGEKFWSPTDAESESEALTLCFGIESLPLPTCNDRVPASYPLHSSHPSRTQFGDSIWYPDGGTCVLHKDLIWVAIRCGPMGTGPGGHRHNDQLSFELNVNGQDIVVDWGTGAYTPDFDLRNRLRSTFSHSTLAPQGVEQNSIPPGRFGLFALLDQTDPQVIEFSQGRFVGQHSGFKSPHIRGFEIGSQNLTIYDTLNLIGITHTTLTLAPQVTVQQDPSGSGLQLDSNGTRVWVEFSPLPTSIQVIKDVSAEGYGLLAQTHRIVAHHSVPSTRTIFTLIADDIEPQNNKQKHTTAVPAICL